MKKLLILILFGCFLSLQAKSQNPLSDSLSLIYHQKAMNDIKDINLRLQNCHDQFKVGTVFQVLGIGTGIIGACLAFQKDSDDPKHRLDHSSR